MSGLEAIIKAQIRASGPMSVAEYMALCLGHPEHGFYIKDDPLGAAGHFTTAPEISQMFGELIGLWLTQVWRDQGSPASFRLIELGPGRGTLMADALRAAGAVSGFAEAADLWLVETSPALRAEQAKRLPGAQWAERLELVPEGPALIVANEFFDALPVRQFLATAEGWREKQVGIDGDRLAWGLSAPLPGQHDAPEGAWRETSPIADAVAAEATRRIARDGGAALIVDYGYQAGDRPPGFTLQALKRHAPADPLAAPGGADLTWLIDFDHLAGTLDPLATASTAQGTFLAALGLGQRAASLADARPDQAGAVADALDRLTGADQMGRLFNVLAAWPQGAAAPPGFGPPGFEETR
ncbi:MAG: SAM-dependent methyltransferase [Paracoccaceae bacterium]|nr:SAM-dependent methyltransferase [Paracoccaceae bacterium]